MAVISILTTVLFESGAMRELDAQLRTMGVSPPMIVTDRGNVSAGPIEHLSDANGEIPDSRIFAETPPNPTEAVVDAAVYQFREADCDAIVAFDGADLAKAVAHEGNLLRYAASRGGPDMACMAVAHFSAQTNPRPLTEADRLSMLEESFEPTYYA